MDTQPFAPIAAIAARAPADGPINAAFDLWREAVRLYHERQLVEDALDLSYRADAAALAVLHAPGSTARALAIKTFVLAHAHYHNAPPGSDGLFPLALPDPATASFEDGFWAPMIDQACAIVPELAAARIAARLRAVPELARAAA